MNVPLLDLHQQTAALRDEILRAVTEVVDSTTYILGPKVAQLEQEVAQYCGAGAGIGVSSGTDALLMTLMALEIGPGDKVLTTPYSFFATVGAILRVGALPVFADVEDDTFNIDPNKMAEMLAADQQGERRIKAIIPVHLFGQCANMGSIMALAQQYGLPVIEDAAQAIGAEYPVLNNGSVHWQKAGSMGLVGCYSFFPSKNLGCLGDGGMVVTSDQTFAQTLRCYRNHGAQPKYYHSKIGGNFRLDPLQAAVLSVKLPHLEQWHKQRQANSQVYHELFAQAQLIDNPIRLPKAVYAASPEAAGHNHHIYNQFVIRVPRRDALREYLHQQNVGCEVYYPVCLHKQECMQQYGSNELSLPIAEQAAHDSLALPIFPELRREQQEYVVECIAKFYRS
ncbi:DegT/DnrJ/EryC1/StrS family aminotransferase [Candidatus Electronema sp. PJ]|uniref:DegT/DnrJ/EryC1/StrS family aminotransferase n=1 Tax=Candidatus Electronema sp. PJ TaxID=3401572 RepID=UPI003AA95D7B